MAASRTYLQTAGDSSDLTTYTFSSQNFGAASSDRYILAAITTRAFGTASLNMSSVTIGGVSATSIATATSSDTNATAAGLWLAAVPTGPSGTVEVVLPREALRCGITLYRLTGINATAHDTGTSAADPGTATLDIPADGLAICCSAAGTSTNDCNWTGLTEDVQQLIEAFTVSSASGEFASEQVGLSVEADWTFSSLEPVTVFAAFGPASAGGFQSAWARGSNVLIGV